MHTGSATISFELSVRSLKEDEWWKLESTL